MKKFILCLHIFAIFAKSFAQDLSSETLDSEETNLAPSDGEIEGTVCEKRSVYDVCHYKGVLVKVKKHFKDDVLNISGLDLVAIRDHAIDNIRVTSLYAFHGNNLMSLNRQSFTGLPDLQHLILDNNALILSENLFAELNNLTLLSLRENGIREIPLNTFRNLYKLSALYLDKNSISSLDQFSFSLLPNLEQLSLSHNEIREIDPYTFHKLRALNTLDLSYNQLENPPHLHVDTSCCQKIITLHYLFLDGNRITNLTLDSLCGCNGQYCSGWNIINSLREVRLSSNAITMIGQDTFYCMKQLEILNLHDNKLTLISKEMFNGLAKLRKLDLSANRIKQFNELAFVELGYLEIINLSSNNITEIDKGYIGLREETSLII